MTKFIVVLSFAWSAVVAEAATYSVNLGFGGTRADASSGSVEAGANGRFGLGIDLVLDARWTFATGTDYVFRRVRWTRADGARLAIDFDYVDVPVDVRVRLVSIVSVYSGLRFGIGVSDKVETEKGTPDYDPVARAIITSFEAGFRVDLPRAFALDAFSEYEIGDGFAKSLRAYRTLGGRLVYSF